MAYRLVVDTLQPLLSGMFPRRCYTSLILDWNLDDVECVKLVLSKILGYGIIVGGSLVKVPQVLKIVAASSAAGISLLSVLLDLAGVTATTAYNYTKQYPFSAYGEGVFIMIETAVILLLSLHFLGRNVQAVLFVITYLLLCVMLWANYVSSAVLWWGQAISAPVVVSGRLWQALANYRVGHTGQLSLLTMSLLFSGCVVRIFTSITETGDPIIISSFVAACFANGVLVCQILFYWEATNRAMAKSKIEKQS